MGLGFLIVIYKTKPFESVKKFLNSTKINYSDVLRLIKIGFGSALQFTFEVAAFVCCALIIGKFGKEQIDAHGIALGIASFTYMFGSGISGASTILIGNYNAQNNFIELKKSIKTALLCVVIVTLLFAIVFISSNTLLPTFFSNDIYIIELSSSLLIIAGLFQLFDGLQVTQLGILRGLEDVKIPTIITLIGYWIICLPLAYLLGIHYNMKSQGVWYAILIGLAFVAFFLFYRIKIVLNKLNLSRKAN